MLPLLTAAWIVELVNSELEKSIPALAELIDVCWPPTSAFTWPGNPSSTLRYFPKRSLKNNLVSTRSNPTDRVCGGILGKTAYLALT